MPGAASKATSRYGTCQLEIDCFVTAFLDNCSCIIYLMRPCSRRNDDTSEVPEQSRSSLICRHAVESRLQPLPYNQDIFILVSQMFSKPGLYAYHPCSVMYG